MAFKKKENSIFIILLIVAEITLPLVATQNIDCKGKAFHCVNSTHFKICVDLGGGVSTTVDDFLIPCPKSTECRNSNYFECEYHQTTTLKPTQLSEVTNDQKSETPAVENFDFSSTLNGSLLSDIELSKVIISTTLIPKISSTIITIDSVIDPKNVNSFISDSATYNNVNTAITEVPSNNLLSTTTKKVILDNNEVNYTEPLNYSSEKVQSTDNNLTGATINTVSYNNTYLATDVTEGYKNKDIENKSTLLSNTFNNHNDKYGDNHTSLKNESFLVSSSENISVYKKTTNIEPGTTTAEIEPSSFNKKINDTEFSTETVLKTSLYNELVEQNTTTSSQHLISPVNPFQNEISITTNRNINIKYHQEKLFTAAQTDIWKENNTTEYNTESVKNIPYHQNEDMPTKKETPGSFLNDTVITDINDAYIVNISTFNYESTTELNRNYDYINMSEKLNVSTKNVSKTFNYSLSDLQLSTYIASNEYISSTGNPLQSIINDEISNVSSLPNTISKSETVFEILNDGSKQINNYTLKYDKTIILTQSESITKTDGTEATETIRENLHTTTTMSPTEFAGNTFIELQATEDVYSTQFSENPHQSRSTISVTNNRSKPINYYNYTLKHDQTIILTQNEFLTKTDGTETTETIRENLQTTTSMSPTELTGDTFIELQATEDVYSTESTENAHRLTSTISVTNNKIQTLPVSIILPTINVLSKINCTTDATTEYDGNINKDIKSTFVNAGNIKAVNDAPVPSFTIINVTDEKTTPDFMSSKRDNTNDQMYDSGKVTQSSPKSTETHNTTTMKVFDANNNSNNKKKLEIFNNTDTTSEEYISNEKLEYSNENHISNKINMQIFNTTNDIDENYVTNITGLIVNESISKNLNMDSPITEKKVTDLNLENMYRPPNDVKLNDKEIKIDTALLAINSSQANITHIYDSNDSIQVDYADKDNIIRTSHNNITTYVDFKVETDKSKANDTGIKMDVNKNILLNDMKLKEGITEANINSIEDSVNNFTNFRTLLRNNTEINLSININITKDNVDKLLKNSINEFNFFENSTVSDVITESEKIALLNSNIDEDKEIKLIAGTNNAIHDIKLTNGNNNRQTNINTLAIQSNIEDTIKLEKNHTKNVDNKQTQNNNPNITKYNKFGLDKTTDNASVTQTVPTFITDSNLEIYSNSDVNVIEDKALDMNFVNSTDKGIPTGNAKEHNEIKIIVDNINASTIDNINLPMYNNTNNSQFSTQRIDVTMNNLQIFNTTIDNINATTIDSNLQGFNTILANGNIAVSNGEHINLQSDTPIEISKPIPEFTILGFNATKNNDVNLNTGTLVDHFNIKTSDTSQQIYNNTQMHLKVFNKSEGNTKENNTVKVKEITVHSTPKDSINHTYPKDFENENIKLEKLQSNLTSTTNNYLKIPHISNLDVTASFYPVIAKEINANTSEIAKNNLNLRNPLEILNSQKSFEAVTLSNTEINVNPEFTSDAPINDFTMPSGSIISNLNYSMETTLENLNTNRRPVSKVEFKNGYETMNSNSNKLLNNKSVSEINDDESNISQILKTNISRPSSKIEQIKINDNVKNIKVDEEIYEDSKYREQTTPYDEKKQSTITNTERSAISKSIHIDQHVNLSSPTSFTCALGSRGKYSDPNDCNKFYICINKLTPIIGRCPDDTVFSEINKQCTTNLSHCIRNNQFKCLAEGRFIDLLSNNSYYICAKNPSKGLVRFKLKCQEGYRLNTDTVHCTLNPSSIEGGSINTSEKSTKEKLSSEYDNSIKSFVCEEEGLFKFPDDSRKYFHCTKKTKSEFRRKIKKCDSDEVFDKDKQKCVDEDSHEEVNGDEKNIYRILKTNSSKPLSKIEPIEIIDYVKYTKVNEEASEDNKYLETTSNNEKKHSIMTNTEKIALSKSKYFIQHVNISSPFICNEGIRGKYSDANDCNKFYVCIGKLIPIIGRCPDETVFSEINKQCTKNLSHCIRNNQFKCLDEGRFIDVLSNNFYYICAKNQSKGLVRFKLKCQEGYHLNTDTVHCMLNMRSIEVDSKNTSEKSTKETVSSESDNSENSFVCEKEGLFKFPDDSRKYFHCTKKSKSLYRRKIKKCDSDEVFDKDKQKCVDEDSHGGN